MRRVAVLLCVGLAASGFFAVGSQARFFVSAATAEEPPDAVLRDCRSRGEAGAPIKMRVTRRDVRIGPLVLGSVRARPASTGDRIWPFVAKAPVFVHARSRVVLAIAQDGTGRAVFQHRGGWVPAVRFTACFERVRAWSYRGTVRQTTFFPFAIATKQRRACVPMELWFDGRAAPTRRIVPIGRGDC